MRDSGEQKPRITVQIFPTLGNPKMIDILTAWSWYGARKLQPHRGLGSGCKSFSFYREDSRAVWKGSDERR